MTVSLKHTFTSAKIDSADPTIVQPSNWNEEHVLTAAAGKVLGRDTSGNGVVQELPISVTAAGNVTIPNNFAVTGTTGLTGTTTVVNLTSTGTATLTNLSVTGTTTLTNALTVANGGTSTTTLPANNVLIGNGTSAVTGVAPGTSGNLLTSNGTAWVSSTPAGSQILQVTRTSNTQLVASNISNLINITSGTFSQTFAAAATLTNGWFCYIRNAGTGEITLDPNGSETIDGFTSYIMYPGETRLVQCNGTSFTTIVLQSFYTVFTASGTFTKPPGYSTLNGILWGGGGTGNVGSFTNGSAGGGGGCGHSFSIISSFFSNSCTVTIGAGGAGVTGATGNTGGDSSFDGKIYGYGGGGGVFSGSTPFGGSGGGILTSSRPLTSSGDNPGFGGTSPLTNQPGGFTYAGGGGGGSANVGGNSFYGGGGSAGNQGFSGATLAGGTSTFGGAGGASNSGAGTAPGGAGGGTTSGTSGAGARGELRIWGGV
jgi:hypothetical protein